ncbi:histidinol dehydrogenase, partial [Klebsiella pneumoniae]|uniref:histidinol dehydrogenase n=1 Tax=Klebsiella pneumoniae TaxID=573 RepID=UPI00273136E1
MTLNVNPGEPGAGRVIADGAQVILLTPDADMGSRVAEAVERQLAALPRAETARVALSASRIIVARDLAQCVAISNQYGPEHLIIQTRQARELV